MKNTEIKYANLENHFEFLALSALQILFNRFKLFKEKIEKIYQNNWQYFIFHQKSAIHLNADNNIPKTPHTAKFISIKLYWNIAGKNSVSKKFN